MPKFQIIPADTFILFADLQTGIADLPMTVTGGRLRKAVSALSRLASLFAIPALATVVQGPDGGTTNLLPETSPCIDGTKIIQRSTADALRNDTLVKLIEASRRKTILISGVATELAVQLPALTAIERGFRPFVVIDACGGMTVRTEAAAIARMEAAGVGFVSVMTLAGEFPENLGDDKGREAVKVIFEMATAG
jgi:nicotinamidase-related amidase